uniref:DNA-directed RNA polymerase n=1 Tax=Lygus hesperus TaxID=30085 RepID=A0A0A9WT51_LYGHE
MTLLEEMEYAVHALPSTTPVNHATVLDYNSFVPIVGVYGSKKFRIHITPQPLHDPAQNNRDTDLFVIHVDIHTSCTNVIVVLPDVIDYALRKVTLSSWLPRFDAISFTRTANNYSKGELVFTGVNATLRNVLSFLSLFTVRTCTLQLDKAHSTDMNDMNSSLGIESGFRALFDELNKLFRRYSVDYHHISLIADAAMHRGRWESFNFNGVIAHSTSPLFQMTFASSKKFLHSAVTRGIDDDLHSLSAAIMVGQKP